MAGIFGFFDYTKPGKGVRKDEPQKKGVALYFDILFRRFWKLILLNLIYVMASIPAIIIGWFLTTFFVSWVLSLAGIDVAEVSDAIVITGVLTTIIFLQLCGSGPASVAMNYVLRKYVNDTHSWPWSDFKDSFVSNFKQGIGVFFINLVIIILCFFSLVFYTFVMKGNASLILRTVIFSILFTFSIMQKYTYLQVATFEVKFKSIYKNAFILSISSIGTNILSLIIGLCFLYGIFSLGMSIPVLAFFVAFLIYFSLTTFTQVFVTNNVVKKYAIAPLENTEDKELKEIDPDFED